MLERHRQVDDLQLIKTFNELKFLIYTSDIVDLKFHLFQFIIISYCSLIFLLLVIILIKNLKTLGIRHLPLFFFWLESFALSFFRIGQ